jgi:hypothetical protein
MHELHAEDYDFRKAWVYSWFPIFLEAYNSGSVRHHFARNAGMQLSSAHHRAVQWVSTRLREIKLPRGFRTPLCYKDVQHPERDRIVSAAQLARISLHDDEIPIALFLSRGLFYQSVALAESGWSYLPHSFRNVLLRDTSAQAAALICSATTTIDAENVLSELDAVFLKRVAQVAKVPEPMYKCISIGAALLRKSRSPRTAIELALEFRDTTQGKAVREYFRHLIQLGRGGRFVDIKAHIAELDKSLRDAVLHKFGYCENNEFGDEKVAIGLSGPLKDVTEAALALLPATKRAAITRILHTPLTPPSGFQVLFSYYFPEEFQYEFRSRSSQSSLWKRIFRRLRTEKA